MSGRVLRFPRRPREPQAPCMLCGAAHTIAGVQLAVVAELDSGWRGRGVQSGDAEELYGTEARLCGECLTKTECGVLVLFEAAHELASVFASDSVQALRGDDDDG